MKLWPRFLLVAALPISAAAQVVVDGTVGSAGPGPVAAGFDDRGQSATYLIHDGLGERSGENLFHSFSSFDVGAGETATFTSGAPIPPENVLARVTGGSESKIFGQLRSTIPGADLWLINPAGWLFGAGSSLDVPGALHVTSGEYVRHADGTRFGVGLEPAPALSIAPVEAFGFLDAEIGQLRIENTQLDLPADETLSLVGGDIGIRGVGKNGASVKAASGRINLVAVASPGEVVLDDSPVDPQMTVDAFSELGKIEVTDRARIDYSGDPGGTAVIRAGSFLLDQSVLDGTTRGLEGHLGVSLDLAVRGAISIYGEGTLGEGTLQNPFMPDRSGQIVSSTVGSGSGGSIRVRAETLRIEHRGPPGVSCANAGFGPTCSGLLSQSRGGDPGDIDVGVRRLDLVGSWPTIRANRNVQSTAGDGAILIATDEMHLNDGGSVTTDALSPGGSTVAHADAGDISIRTRLLETTGFSSISANTLGSGDGGNIHIVADVIRMQNNVPGGTERGGVRSQTLGSGNGGEILIEARDVTLEERVWVATNSYDPFLFLKSSLDPGDAGSIRMDVDQLRVLDGATITSSTIGGGSSGDIVIFARSVLVRGYGVIESLGTGTHHVGVISTYSSRGDDIDRPLNATRANHPVGNAGSIDIEADDVRIDGGTIISSTLSDGAAGDVTIRANRLVAAASPGNWDVPIQSGSFRVGYRRVGSNEDLPYEQGPAGNVNLIGIGTGSELRVEGIAAVSANTGTPASGGNLFVDFDRVTLDGGTLSVASALYPDENHPVGSLAERNVTGEAGDLTVIAHDSLRLENGGRITAQSIRSDGGNLDIQAGNAVELFGSSITAEVGIEADAEATGGNISIDPEWVLLDDGSVISAEAHAGNGGNISIRTQGLFVSPDSRISASSQYGVSGTVAIDSPESNLSGELANLSQDYVDAAGLIGDRCGAGSTGAGSFAVSDAVAIAPAPDEALSSPLLELSAEGLAQIH